MTRQVRKTTITIGDRTFDDEHAADEWERMLDVTELHVRKKYPRMRNQQAIDTRVRMIADGIEAYADHLLDFLAPIDDDEHDTPTTTTNDTGEQGDGSNEGMADRNAGEGQGVPREGSGEHESGNDDPEREGGG